LDQVLKRVDPHDTSNALPSIAEIAQYIDKGRARTTVGDVTLDKLFQILTTYVNSAHISFSRRLYITELGMMGLAPKSTSPGDSIYYLHGALTPFVLRKKDGGECALMVETYLHGFMHGEILGDEYDWKNRVGDVRIA
jgi:hypothetical protein